MNEELEIDPSAPREPDDPNYQMRQDLFGNVDIFRFINPS